MENILKFIFSASIPGSFLSFRCEGSPHVLDTFMAEVLPLCRKSVGVRMLGNFMIINQESMHQRKEATAVPGVFDLF